MMRRANRTTFKRLFIGAVLAAATVIPATASAEKINNVVSIHADDYEFAERIYGTVQAPKHKCEKFRTIVLYYDGGDLKRRGPGFSPVDETTTNNEGEYEFESEAPTKRGLPPFPSGDYFVRALKKDVGDDVCKRADSRVIEIFNFS